MPDMRLHARVVRQRSRTSCRGGGYLKLGGGHERTRAELRFSARDAEAFRYERALGARRRGAARHGPQDAAQCRRQICSPRRRAGAAQAGWACRSRRSATSVRRRRDFLDGWFENAPIRNDASASTRWSATMPARTRPAAPMSCSTMSSGRDGKKKGAWGHSIGMGAITRLMADAPVPRPASRSAWKPRSRGCSSTGAGVAGVRLENGEEIAAEVVAANIGPALLCSPARGAQRRNPPTSPGAWI